MPDWSRWFYDGTYRITKPAWDTDATPLEIVEWAGNNRSRGRALDLGCGSGAHSIYLAQHGFSVVGVDFSPKAIELARAKAKRAGVSVDFRIGDVTRLDFLKEPFDLVIDVLCFHGLAAEERTRYAQEVARLTQRGSTFMLYAFDRPQFFGRYGLTAEAVRRTFTPAFALVEEKHDVNRRRRDVAWYRFIRQ